MFCFTLALEEEQENKLEELFNRYHLDLIRFAHSIVKSTEEAEDIVQEAFIRIFRNIAKIENSTDREAKNFMLITVRRLAIPIWRVSGCTSRNPFQRRSGNRRMIRCGRSFR